MPLLDISNEGRRILTLAGKSRQKIVEVAAALKIDVVVALVAPSLTQGP